MRAFRAGGRQLRHQTEQRRGFRLVEQLEQHMVAVLPPDALDRCFVRPDHQRLFLLHWVAQKIGLQGIVQPLGRIFCLGLVGAFHQQTASMVKGGYSPARRRENSISKKAR